MSCKNFHCVSTITVNTDNVTLSFADTITVTDTQNFCFKMKSSIPSTASTLPVIISVNGSTVPLWNKYGNPVLASKLKPCRIYKGYYGATTPHIILWNHPLNGVIG